MKGTYVHIKNMLIQQICNRKVRDFAMAFRVRNVYGAFEKRVPGPQITTPCERSLNLLRAAGYNTLNEVHHGNQSIRWVYGAKSDLYWSISSP